jgi:branched-chain amino acid transport system permease protein
MSSLFVDQIINGLVTGSIYALAASGVALTYGTMRILNFAHGEFYMLGAYFCFYLISQYNFDVTVSILLAVVGVGVIATLVHTVMVARLLKRPDPMFSVIAATMGLSILLQNSAMVIFGEQYRTLDYYVPGMVTIGSLRLPAHRLLIFAAACAMMIAMAAFLRFTKAGMAARATSADPDAAKVLGIPTGRVHTAVFAASCMMAAFAGTLLLPLQSVYPWIGAPYTLKAFVVVVLGGLGSVGGAVLGGFLLGIVEATGVMFTGSEWRDAFAYGVVVLVIWIRPSGIFGKLGRAF